MRPTRTQATVRTKMDSKEGIERVTPIDARAAGLLDPSLLWLGADAAATADPPREWADSPAGSCTGLDETPRWESYCLYVRVLRDSDAILEQDRRVPEYCWNAGISKDICDAQTRVVPGTFSIDLLSNKEFLVYKLPKTGRGMSDHESVCHADLIAGLYLWAGILVDVYITQWTSQQARRDKAKTREYRRKITVERLAAAQARLQDLDLVAQKCKECTLNPVRRGRGMICRADKYLTQQHGREPERVPGLAPTLPVFPDRTAMPDDYHLAWEPSEFEYDTKETDPEGLEDDPEEDDDDASVASDSTYKSSGHDTDWTRRTNNAKQNQRCNQQKRKEGWASAPPMLRGKRTGIRVKWSCLCSGTPLKKVP